jgi:predicted HD phosphohydrolase
VTPQEAAARLEPLLALLEHAKSSDYIGEGVSQLDHALQAAARARAASAPAHEILAALLHDVGHLCAGPAAPSMAGLGVVRHEEVGADHLAGLGFGGEVVDLVRGHVAAKRYLVAAEPGYAARLSEASVATLRHQGGPMSASERRDFEALPQFRALLRVRTWDEAAKQRGLRVDDLSSYASLLRDHLLQR